MSSVSIPEILKLSVPERIRLIGAIWDTIAAAPDSLPVTKAQRQELDRRLVDHQDHPADARTWEAIRDSLPEKR